MTVHDKRIIASQLQTEVNGANLAIEGMRHLLKELVEGAFIQLEVEQLNFADLLKFSRIMSCIILDVKETK